MTYSKRPCISTARNCERHDPTDTDLEVRVSRLEAWVEALMRNLAGLGLKAVLCELDDARGADEPH
jgi:hypothetical protein